MGWEDRNGRLYYYEKERRGGRIVSIYRGSGPIATCSARLNELARERRSLRRSLDEGERAISDDAEAQLNRYAKAVDRLLGLALQSAGYHRPNRGPWRRRRMSQTHEIEAANNSQAPPNTVSSGLPTGAERDAVFRRAQTGDKTALPALRAILAAEPETVNRLGNMRVYAQSSLIALATKSGDRPEDFALGESMNRMIDKIRADLAGPEPTPMESLLASRAALDWFAVYLFEYFAARELQSRQTLAQAGWQQRRLQQAHSRFLASMRTLAQVKRMLRKPAPTVQINAVNAQAVFGMPEAISRG
ncbi:MAG: hypothetical protein U0800_08145 [Isosphaeraceae bacterium]